MASNISNNNKRIAKNTLLLYIRMFVTMLISLYTSRVILKTLGVEDFGIYNVVGGVVSMLGFITGSMTGASSRFITYNIGKNDISLIKSTFANILYIHLLLMALILILSETVGLWLVVEKLQIPDNRMNAAMFVFQISVISALLSIFLSPYNAMIVAHERMAVFAYISICDVILKLLIVFLLSVIPFDRLITYSFLFLLIQLIDFLIYYIYCRRNFKNSLAPPKKNDSMYNEIIKFAGWTLTGNLAVIGYTQGLNILLNIFFGPSINAARGIAVQVQNVCRNFTYNFQMAINPQITKSYASHDMSYMHFLIAKSSKFSLFIMLLVTLPICLETKYILQLWLGEVPEHTVFFLRLVLGYSILYTLQNPVVHAINAVGKLKVFQIVESSMLLTIVPFAYISLKYYNVSPEFVFIIHLIVEVFTQIARLYIVLPQISMPFSYYYKEVLCPLFLFIVVGLIAPIVTKVSMSSDIYSFILVSLVSLTSVSLSFYIFGCNRKERQIIKEIVINLMHKVRLE